MYTNSGASIIPNSGIILFFNLTMCSDLSSCTIILTSITNQILNCSIHDTQSLFSLITSQIPDFIIHD